MPNVNQIIIGLGEVGCKMVNNFAKYLDSHGGIDGKQAFLFLDSNREDLNKLWSKIRQPNVTKEDFFLEKPPDVYFTGHPWITQNIAGTLFKNGVGTRRAVSKAYYDYHKLSIQNKIMNIVTNLQQRNNINEFLIVIFCALGGGTGSGLIPDLSLDIKRWMSNNFPSTIIFGFGILPSENDGQANKINAMAALKELNFLLSIDNARNGYFNPFHLFILASRDDCNDRLQDITLEETIIKFLSDLVRMGGDLNVIGDDAFHRNKWFDFNDLVYFLSHNTNSFSTIGYKSTEFPKKKIDDFFKMETNIEVIENFLKNQLINKGKINELQEALKKNDYSNIKIHEDIEALNEKLSVVKKSMRDLVNSNDVKNNNTLAKSLTEQIERLKSKLEEHVNQMKILVDICNESNTYAQTLHQEILQPICKDHRKIITVSNHEIQLLKEGLPVSFQQAMGNNFLNRPEVIYDAVQRPFVNLNDITRILLDYDYSPKVLNQEVEAELSNRDFITKQNVKCALSILCTADDNIGNINQLNFAAARSNLTREIAEEAQMFPFKNGEKFKVDIYNLWIGLHPWTSANGEEFRLRDIDTLKQVYDNNRAILNMHHSLFLGDFNAFNNLTCKSKSIGNTNQEKTGSVISFWEKYNCEDPFLKIPITLAEIDQEVSKLSKQKDITELNEVLSTLEEYKENLEEEKKNILAWIKQPFRGNIVARMEGDFLFNWNDSPGDNIKLKSFLNDSYNFDLESIEITKNENGDTIEATDSNNKSISLQLNNNNTKVDLRIDDDKTDKLIAKTEDNNLNIYQKNNIRQFIKDVSSNIEKQINNDVFQKDINKQTNEINKLRNILILIKGHLDNLENSL